MYLNIRGGTMKLLLGLFTVLFSVSSLAEQLLNSTQKRIRNSAALVAELNNKKLSEDFKRKVLQKLKNNNDKEIFEEIVNNWPRKKYGISVYLDEYYLTFNDQIYSRIRIERQDEDFLLTLNGQKAFLVKADNIFGSLQKRKTTDNSIIKYYTLLFGKEAWARTTTEEILDENQMMFTLVAGQLVKYDEKSVLNRDTSIKIKMGETFVPTSQWSFREYITMDYWQTNDNLQCSKKFSGDINGVEYKAEVKNDKIEFYINEGADKIEIDMTPDTETYENRDKFVKERQIENRTCQRLNCADIPIESPKIKALQKERDHIATKILKLDENFKKDNGLKSIPKYRCSSTHAGPKRHEETPHAHDITCEFLVEPDVGIISESKNYIRLLGEYKTSDRDTFHEISDARSQFFKELNKISHYIKSLDRCCGSKQCREDLFEKKQIKLNNESSGSK